MSPSVGELFCSTATIVRELLFQIKPGKCLKVPIVEKHFSVRF